MKKTLFYLFPVFLSALLIFGSAFAEDWQPPSRFRKQYSSETRDFQSIKEKDINLAISIHHAGSTSHSDKSFLSLDMKRLKREAEMELFRNNAYENPSSPNTVAVVKMAFDEFTFLKEFKRFLDGMEAKVEHYRRKFKLKGEVGLAEQSPTGTSDSAGENSENTLRGTSESARFFLNLMPERISWHLSYDLDSNCLKGEVEIGNHFVIEGNWGSDSDVRAMLTFPF